MQKDLFKHPNLNLKSFIFTIYRFILIISCFSFNIFPILEKNFIFCAEKLRKINFGQLTNLISAVEMIQKPSKTLQFINKTYFKKCTLNLSVFSSKFSQFFHKSFERKHFPYNFMWNFFLNFNVSHVFSDSFNYFNQ